MIRPAHQNDAAAIAALHVRSWQWAYRGLLPDAYLYALPDTLQERTARWRELLSAATGDAQTWVAELDGEIVGFASAGSSGDFDAPPGAGELYAIYLEESAIGQGIGRALLAKAIDFLKEGSYQLATLWVLDGDQRARGFYDHAGWRPDGTTRSAEISGVLLQELRYQTTLH